MSNTVISEGLCYEDYSLSCIRHHVRDHGNGHLLLSYVKPYRHIGTSKIGQWIQTGLEASGVDTAKYKANSTRSAAASRASQLIPTDEILKHIGWSGESKFQKFYNKPVIARNSFAGAVLKYIVFC